jgi:dTDP-4-dehydrorhamnose reductase
VTDPEQLGEVFWLARPEVVAPLAAMADANQCQRMPQQSTEINVRGTEHIARLCALQRVMLALLVVVADTDDEKLPDWRPR